jgi:hypothetical protein
MFIGHLALALGAKRIAPKVSLGWLVAATLFIDLLWPLFLLLGWERVAIVPGITAVTPLDFIHYPITHSLLGVLGWSALAALAYAAWKKDRRGALVIGALVLSHWLLDAISHRPDLPIWFGESPLVGLGLWNSITATLVVEILLFAFGLAIYLRTTQASDGAGRFALLAWLVIVLASYAASVFGPPPPNPQALAYAALASYLLPLWAAWFDRHRGVTAAA